MINQVAEHKLCLSWYFTIFFDILIYWSLYLQYFLISLAMSPNYTFFNRKIGLYQQLFHLDLINLNLLL